jgi:type-F conjugative transfer system pilin assembly protein TrbC
MNKTFRSSLCLLTLLFFPVLSAGGFEDSIDFAKSLQKQSQGQDLNSIESYVDSLKDRTPCRMPPLDDKEGVNEGLFVFMSFSVPDNIWLELSKSLEGKGGTIVIQGLPQNSFEKLISKIKDLKTKGITANIEINPKLFDQYEVQSVPCFVQVNGDSFDKISGNISLSYFLSLVEKSRESAND